MGNYKDGKARLDERENCHLRLGYKPENGFGKTKKHVEEQRKQEIIENLT